MKKNNTPYSRPHSVKLSFAADFTTFAFLHGRIFYKLYNNKDWFSIPEVPGSLDVSVTQPDPRLRLHEVNAKFRVSFAELDNFNELMPYIGPGLVLSYTSAGNQVRCVGTKQEFLTMSMNEVPGFDGYEITLIGKQSTPEGFIK